jgi:DNA polymerase-3 subunit delta
MITVLYGKDDFSAHEALAKLISELDTDGMLADNTTRVEGAQAKPDELLLLCQTIPFLGSCRLIIVRGLLERFEAQRGRGRRRTAEPALGTWEPFIEALHDLPETTALVFVDGGLSTANPMLRALRSAKATVREFPQPAAADVAKWINERAATHGARLEARAVAALAQLAGGDQLWLLDSELRKLATYAGDRPITEEDVHSLVSLARQTTVFALADAVAEGRPRDALDLLHRLLAAGEAPQAILSLIARQYRLLLLTRELLDQRVRGPEISARLNVQGFVAQRLMKQAPLHSESSLHADYRRLLEADLSIKRGVYDNEPALELLVFDLASRAATPGTSPGGRQGYSRRPAGRGPSPPRAATA